jgi:DNA repair exonuclease SbcCD ATPase subunit
MKDKIPVLNCELKRYERKSKKKSADGTEQVTRRYMIPVKKDQIEGTSFENVEDIVILSKEDFHHELKKSKEVISTLDELKLLLKEKDLKLESLQAAQNELKKVQSHITSLKNAYNSEIEELNTEILRHKDIAKQYEELGSINRELEREVKRLTDLRTLEAESFRIKMNEIEMTKEEYEKLKKSHEMLWDVVQEKDKAIKEMEDNGFVGTFLRKIRKKEGK